MKQGLSACVLQQVNNQPLNYELSGSLPLVMYLSTSLFKISFLSRTLDISSFFLSLYIYLWLAEISQQPITAKQPG